MKTRLILLTRRPNAYKANAITDAIRNVGAGWWHWFQGAWLICDPKGKDEVWWRDYLQSIAPGEHMVIVKAGDSNKWSGFGSNEEFKWMHSVWIPE
jgi:hypothetical protein